MTSVIQHLTNQEHFVHSWPLIPFPFSPTHTHTVYTHVAQVTKSSKDRLFSLNHYKSIDECLLSIVKR